MKHIDTVFLWVQTIVTEGKISLGKKPTKEMLADFLTKHVDAATMLNCMSGSGLKFQSGESKLTLKASAQNSKHSEEFEGDVFSLCQHVIQG